MKKFKAAAKRRLRAVIRRLDAVIAACEREERARQEVRRN